MEIEQRKFDPEEDEQRFRKFIEQVELAEFQAKLIKFSPKSDDYSHRHVDLDQLNRDVFSVEPEFCE